jgi:hypothetical protein
VSGKANAVLSFAGAVVDPKHIEATQRRVQFHSTNDPVFQYNTGKPFAFSRHRAWFQSCPWCTAAVPDQRPR